MRTSPPPTNSFGNKPKRNTTMLVVALCAVLLSVVSCIGWFTNRRKLVKTRIQLDYAQAAADTLQNMAVAATAEAPSMYEKYIYNLEYSDSKGLLTFRYESSIEESANMEIKVLEYQGWGEYSYNTILSQDIYSTGNDSFSYHISPIYSYDGVDPVVEIWMNGWLVGGGSVDAPEGALKAAVDAQAPATK